jgi:hypothetical protein
LRSSLRSPSLQLQGGFWREAQQPRFLDFHAAMFPRTALRLLAFPSAFASASPTRASRRAFEQGRKHNLPGSLNVNSSRLHAQTRNRPRRMIFAFGQRDGMRPTMRSLPFLRSQSKSTVSSGSVKMRRRRTEWATGGDVAGQAGTNWTGKRRAPHAP